MRRLKETIITAAIICTSDLMRFLFLFFYHYWQPTTAHVVGSFNLYGSPDWNYHEVIVIVCVRFSPSPPLVLSLLQQRWFFRASSIVLQNYSLEIKEKKKKTLQNYNPPAWGRNFLLRGTYSKLYFRGELLNKHYNILIKLVTGLTRLKNWVWCHMNLLGLIWN